MVNRILFLALMCAIVACGAPAESDSSSQFFSASSSSNYPSHLAGTELKAALHEDIRSARKLNYNQVWVYLKTIDADPNDASRVVMVYSRRSLPYSQIGGGEESTGWNREHVWPSSRGFSRTDMPAHTDLHNLRPCEVEINRLHADRMFGEVPHGVEAQGIRMDKSSDLFEPADEVKGDIARILFYMDVRYEGTQGKESDLRLVETLPKDLVSRGRDLEGNGYLGHIKTLLDWHENDPVDDHERRRQEKVYEVQGNRNPFVDEPDLVERLYLFR